MIQHPVQKVFDPGEKAFRSGQDVPDVLRVSFKNLGIPRRQNQSAVTNRRQADIPQPARPGIHFGHDVLKDRHLDVVLMAFQKINIVIELANKVPGLVYERLGPLLNIYGLTRSGRLEEI